VQLLNELRGGVVFNVIGEAGAPPNTIFTMGLELDGKVYTGDGKNKKDAKKNCALEVLRELYKITYPSEGTNMDETV
jgi:dsRNA-specific ribonuclease